ncbi:type III-A CRISPR-associated protein Csm2 [Paenibacillus tyrfis]|uniref:type III-A CRISPR-associated protein Csm2 n=1 Tax=Paenibacillus tyrfis TaxID=1501230 RepID=UPI00209D09F5|nr:type III-A CRISPR-associated protein Csm2 [Paenibacillus tyrfis]MCP1309507.1 type III-A CRISPR-associated protein Csm2 [Paenibacillus tyrfis]
MWPERYLVDGYYDEKGQLRREIIVEHAKQVADMLAKRKLTSASMRRFYNKLLGIVHKFRMSGEFDRVRPQIDELEMFAAQAVKRKNNPAPMEFELFIQKNVELANKSEKGLLGFFQHFQSVVAFSPNMEGGNSRESGNSGARNHGSQKHYGNKSMHSKNTSS